MKTTGHALVFLNSQEHRNYRAAKEQLQSDLSAQQEQAKSVVGAYETIIEQRQEMLCDFSQRGS